MQIAKGKGQKAKGKGQRAKGKRQIAKGKLQNLIQSSKLQMKKLICKWRKLASWQEGKLASW